jgi:hypothetical protein
MEGSPVDRSDPRSPLTAANAHNEAMSLSMAAVVQRLSDLLGATAVAEIGGVHETRAVQQWIDGERGPQRGHVLRFALQLALMICSLADRDMARAWFHGSNPHLDDRSPVQLLRGQPLESVQVLLMVAVRAFVARAAAL